MVLKALSTLFVTAVLGLVATVGAGNAPPKASIRHQVHYSYCQSCQDADGGSVSTESDVFVPPQVLDLDVDNHRGHAADITVLPGHGLALGLSRHPASCDRARMTEQTADAPYQSGPPPPIADPITTVGIPHHCPAQSNKESLYCSFQVQGGIPEIGGILFADSGRSRNSYIFIPCAYVPVLAAPTAEGAGEFRRAHPELTLSCAGNASVDKYPHQYRGFSCKASPSSHRK